MASEKDDVKATSTTMFNAAPEMLTALKEAERCLDLLAKVNMQSRDDRTKLQDLASSRLDGIRVLKHVRAALLKAEGRS